MIPNILFDLDGTLMHTLPGIERTIAVTLETLSRSVDGRAIRPLVGMPLEEVFGQLLGKGDPSVPRAVRTYRDLFVEVGLPHAFPFAGIPVLVRDLHRQGRRLFVATNRNEEISRTMLTAHGLAGFFTEIRGERPGEEKDAKAPRVAELIRNHALDPADTVMVGDRSFDALAARANGVPAVGVTWGYGTAEELTEAGVQRLVSSPDCLAAALGVESP